MRLHATLAAGATRSWLLFVRKQNKTISTIYIGEKTILAFALPFCQLKSTNIVNSIIQRKVETAAIMGMSYD